MRNGGHHVRNCLPTRNKIWRRPFFTCIWRSNTRTSKAKEYASNSIKMESSKSFLGWIKKFKGIYFRTLTKKQYGLCIYINMHICVYAYMCTHTYIKYYKLLTLYIMHYDFSIFKFLKYWSQPTVWNMLQPISLVNSSITRNSSHIGKSNSLFQKKSRGTELADGSCIVKEIPQKEGSWEALKSDHIFCQPWPLHADSKEPAGGSWKIATSREYYSSFSLSPKKIPEINIGIKK